METKEILSEGHPLRTGDIVEVHTTATGLVWVQAWQWDRIERAVNKDPHFEIISVEYGDNQLIMRIRVVKNPLLTSALIGLIIKAGIGLMVFLSVDRVYRITTGDAGEAIANAAVNWGVAAALGGLFLLVKKGR